MRPAVTCLCILCLATMIVYVVGQTPTRTQWGTEGVRSLQAVSMICLGASIIGFLPVAIVSSIRPAYIGQAALGATALRLLLTLGGGGVYQVMAKPHLPSYLFWAVVIYCLLLAIETSFSIYLVRRGWVSNVVHRNAVPR